MKHPDEYAWELRRGLEDGGAHRDYIEAASYKDGIDFVINEDGLRYIEQFIRKIISDACDYTVNKTMNVVLDTINE